MKKSSRLTSSAQSYHATLPETEEHDLSRSIATLLHKNILDKQPQQLRTFLQPGVSVETARRGVKDDVVAPVRTLQIE